MRPGVLATICAVAHVAEAEPGKGAGPGDRQIVKAYEEHGWL
jgi:hypothetical protein